MKALIIIAHGSRREESNQEIKNLSDKVKELVKTEFKLIEYAFLEMAKPTLMDSIDSVISENISEITIFPYFLNSGVHLQTDIPAILKNAKIKYPNCVFHLCRPVGAYRKMAEIILDQLKTE